MADERQGPGRPGRPGQPSGARDYTSDTPAAISTEGAPAPRDGTAAPGVPPRLVAAAGWAWRLVALGVAGYAVVWVLSRIALVVLPALGALLLAALLRPLTRLLDRAVPRLAAAWLTLLLAAVALGGVGYFIGLRAFASAPELIDQLIASLRQLLNQLQALPIFDQIQLQAVQEAIIDFLRRHRERLTSLATTFARFTALLVTALVFMAFITFFFVYEGERLWGWFIERLPYRPAARLDRAGLLAWQAVSGWIRGTFVIATIHGIVVAITLLVLGVPLVAPLAMLVFLGSFIPIVGALVAGGIAVLVTLATQGLLDAAILLAVLLVENQLEGNLLQPLIMGHYVKLHPLVIGTVLVVGAVLFGIVGAVVAVPAAGVVYRAVPALFGSNGAEQDHTHPP